MSKKRTLQQKWLVGYFESENKYSVIPKSWLNKKGNKMYCRIPNLAEVTPEMIKSAKYYAKRSFDLKSELKYQPLQIIENSTFNTYEEALKKVLELVVSECKSDRSDTENPYEKNGTAEEALNKEKELVVSDHKPDSSVSKNPKVEEKKILNNFNDNDTNEDALETEKELVLNLNESDSVSPKVGKRKKINKLNVNSKKRKPEIKNTKCTTERNLETGSLITAEHQNNVIENIHDKNLDSSLSIKVDTNIEQIQEEATPKDIVETEKPSQSNKIEMEIIKRANETSGYIIGFLETQNESILSRMTISDDIDTFFKSIALTVKKLPPQGIVQAKFKVLTLVSDLQNQYILNNVP